MSKQKRIFLIGATGTVGSQVAQLLHNRGADISLGVRQPKALQGWMAGVAIPFDYQHADLFESTLQGHQKLFIIAPPSPQPVEAVKQLLHAARKSGIEHVVAVTGLGAATRGDSFVSARTDIYVREQDIPWTLLRPNWFMQNFLTYYHDDIMSRGEIFFPAADSRISFIDVRDIADVAATVLLSNEGYEAKGLVLTGSEDLNHHEVAEVITHKAGRKVIYRPVSEESYIETLQKLQWSEKSIGEMVQLFREMRNGQAAHISDDVEKLLGRRPHTFEQFVHDYASRWK